MTINEIKKALYRERPIAKCIWHNKRGDLKFQTTLRNGTRVTFDMPFEEAYDSIEMHDEIPAQLLIRWIHE